MMTSTDLRHLEVPRAAHDEAKTVLADTATGMNDDTITDQGVQDTRAGANRTIAADTDFGTDHGRGADDCPRTDFRSRTDHGSRFDCHVLFQPSRGMDMRPGDAASFIKRRRTQRMWKQFARDFHERAKGLGHDQDGNTLRQPCGKRRGGQTSTRMRGSGGRRVTLVLEKAEIARPRPIECCDVVEHARAQLGVRCGGTGQSCNRLERQALRVP